MTEKPRPAPESQPPADDAAELAQLRALRERVLAVQRGDGDLRWLGVLDVCDYILGGE